MSKELIDILYRKETWEVYKKFCEIENSIDNSNELYNYFDEINKMLYDEKDYIKLREFRLICKLSKYDNQNKIDISALLNVLNSDKPTIVRQCLSSLNYLLSNKKEIENYVKEYLIKFNYSKYKDTMQPLIKKDIENVLK